MIMTVWEFLLSVSHAVAATTSSSSSSSKPRAQANEVRHFSSKEALLLQDDAFGIDMPYCQCTAPNREGDTPTATHGTTDGGCAWNSSSIAGTGLHAHPHPNSHSHPHAAKGRSADSGYDEDELVQDSLVSKPPTPTPKPTPTPTPTRCNAVTNPKRSNGAEDEAEPLLGPRRRLSRICRVAARWNISLVDAQELCQAFEAAQTTPGAALDDAPESAVSGGRHPDVPPEDESEEDDASESEEDDSGSDGEDE